MCGLESLMYDRFGLNFISDVSVQTIQEQNVSVDCTSEVGIFLL
jgi:hypothetical protein